MPSNINGPVSVSDILGVPKKINTATNDSSLCSVCDKPIPSARIVALKSLNLPRTLWAHVGCSTVTKTKGVYLGEVGTSELQLCDKIYDDSVRSVFRSADKSDSEDED